MPNSPRLNEYYTNGFLVKNLAYNELCLLTFWIPRLIASMPLSLVDPVGTPVAHAEMEGKKSFIFHQSSQKETTYNTNTDHNIHHSGRVLTVNRILCSIVLQVCHF